MDLHPPYVEITLFKDEPFRADVAEALKRIGGCEVEDVEGELVLRWSAIRGKVEEQHRPEGFVVAVVLEAESMLRSDSDSFVRSNLTIGLGSMFCQLCNAVGPAYGGLGLETSIDSPSALRDMRSPPVALENCFLSSSYNAAPLHRLAAADDGGLPAVRALDGGVAVFTDGNFVKGPVLGPVTADERFGVARTAAKLILTSSSIV